MSVAAIADAVRRVLKRKTAAETPSLAESH